MFQSILRRQSKNILGGVPNMRLLCHYSCAGSSLDFNKAYAPGRVYVCVLRHAESAGDVKESRAHIVPQPWQCGPDLRDGSVFTACPFHSSPHSTSLALAAVTLPVSPPKYIRPRDEGGLSLFYLKALI